MPRKRLIQTTEFPYHLTARVNNRARFPGNLKFIWKTLTGESFIQQVLAGFRVHPLPVAVLPPKWNLASLIPNDAEAQDQWLNKPHRQEENEAIRLGLRRKEFRISPDSKNRKKVVLDL